LATDYTEDAVIVSPMFPGVRGRDAIERSFVALFDIFPDWEMSFEDPVIDGARAVNCCTVRATQVGAFMGVAGTGRRFEFTCVLAFDVRDGLIAHERRIYDFTGMLIQLGVLRGKPAI
jgi:predicted ester cyclase